MRYMIIDEFMDIFRARELSDEVWDLFEAGTYLFIVDMKEGKVAFARNEWKELKKYHDVYDALEAEE